MGPTGAKPANVPSQPQQPMQPGQMQMKLPQGFRMPQQGTTLFAQVAGKDGQGYLMRMGDQLLRAQSGTPLQVGQSVQMKVQGDQPQGNMLKMQLVPGGGQARHSAGELADSLSNMKIPLSENTMETAKAMVESKVPLTKDNLQTMQKLTQMPEGAKSQPPMSDRVSSVVFLQQNNLPVTPQNMSCLANFLAQNPQLGQQMACMNDELKRLIEKGGGDAKQFDDLREMVLEAIEGGGGNIGKTKDKKSPPPPKKFFNAAKQAGIEFGTSPFPGSDEDEWELLAAYRELRRKVGEELGEEETAELARMLNEAEDTVQAQRLLNRAVMGEIGCLYFQVPIRLREDCEVWLYFRRKGGGQEDSLGDEFRAEFLVTTEYLGNLFFIVEVTGVEVSVVIEVENQATEEFVGRYAVVLQERIAMAGWKCQGVSVTGRKTVPGNPWMNQEEITEMVSYDVQA
ncbi:hypothetical protein JST97_10605 [bacterium]|nr:hypothetical protein [bacterium]